MKILNITAQKPHSTGSGTYLTELVKSFDKAGHKQAVVAGVYFSDEVTFPNSVSFYPVYYNSNISFPVLGMSDSMPYPSTKYSDLNEAMIEEFEKEFINTIDKAIAELEPDIILCHHLFLLTAIVRKHYPNAIVYGICHGSDLRQMNNCNKLSSRIRPCIRELNHIFALHEEQAKQISDIFDIPNNKISVIGSGYNSELFNCEGRIARKANDPVRICFAGKMSIAKGVEELLNAAYRINDLDKTNFELILAGGCQEKRIKKRLNTLPENIKYLGLVPQSKLSEIYKICDIFILPSYFEGLGLVLIEAMASGLIPICTDIPGIKEWINNNVTNPNVKYIPMPEMAGIDTPTEMGRANFENDITNILLDTISEIEQESEHINSVVCPDCSKITWQEVSNKILNF